MKDDIDQTINEAKNHRILFEKQINRIKQQRTILNDLYEREIKNLNDKYEFVTHICENSYVLISEYEQYIKQFQLIKQDQVNNQFIQELILQIDEILQQQQNQIISKTNTKNIQIIFIYLFCLESKDEISTTRNILSILDSETTIDSNK